MGTADVPAVEMDEDHTLGVAREQAGIHQEPVVDIDADGNQTRQRDPIGQTPHFIHPLAAQIPYLSRSLGRRMSDGDRAKREGSLSP